MICPKCHYDGPTVPRKHLPEVHSLGDGYYSWTVCGLKTQIDPSSPRLKQRLADEGERITCKMCVRINAARIKRG